ncbi:MAG TPA: ATP-binding protein [Mucilaginibacter sp.]|nr:ATP-binding protein [Mucilaginibacter sp.]
MLHKGMNFVRYAVIATALFLGTAAALNSCNNKGNSSRETNFQTILDSASAIFDEGKPKEAIALIDSAYSGDINLPLKERFGYYNLKYNYFYHKIHNRGEAMLYADSMLDLFDTQDKKLKYASEYGQAHFFKGDLLFDDNHYNEAYKYFYQGKIIANNNLDICNISDYSYRMGMIMYKLGHYREAASNFKNSFREHGSCNITFRSFYRRQELLDNAGICYSKLNETDSAMYFFKRALAFIEQYSERFKTSENLLDVARGVVFGNEANVYITQGNRAQAIRLLKKSAEINLRKGNDNVDAQLSELKLAHIYYDTHQTDSLFALLKNIQQQSDSIHSIDVQADWNYLMAKYYYNRKESALALTYLKEYDKLTDSIVIKEKHLKEADVSEQINRLEKTYELDVLQKNNQSQKVLLKVAIIFAVLFFVILFLVYSNWQRSKKNIKKLDDLNSQINEQNQSLSSALTELKISSQEKDRILRTVAHDLRNPIGGISSLTGLMLAEAQTDEQKESIALIKETSDNSINLINEILEATNNKKVEQPKEPSDINPIIANSVELLKFKAAEKNQQIETELFEEPILLQLNREKIWRVISNLISNAIKFSPPGSKIKVKTVLADREVRVIVEDNGIGIPDNINEKVFNMFTDAKRPGTSGEKSFGLGLSICRQIIEDHDGKIWFEPNPTGGTIFIVSFHTQG